MRAICLLTILAASSGAGPLSAQCEVHEHQRVLPPDGEDANGFGRAVALCGDRAAIGAPQATNGGAVFLFRFDGSSWIEDGRLVASDGVGGQGFGHSLALDGDTLAVGAIRDGVDRTGAIYVFQHDGGSWHERHKLVSPDPETWDVLGLALDLEGDVVVASDADDDLGSHSGSVRVFRFDESSWTHEQKLLASDGGDNHQFGRSVAIQDGRIVVGALWADSPRGATTGQVYVFEHDGGSWLERHRLIGSQVRGAEQFGQAVALEDERLAVGAPGSFAGQPYAGRVYLFEDRGDWWEEVAILHGGGQEGDRFGDAVDLCGDFLEVGSIQSSAEPGHASSFRHDGQEWRAVHRQRASDGGPDDKLGYHIALDGGWVVVGNNHHPSTEVRKAYFFELTALGMDARPTRPVAGQELELRSCAGAPGELGLQALVDVSGTPWFLIVRRDAFDAGGSLRSRSIIPPGLEGLDLEFLTLGFVGAGELATSNRATVSID